ncbi:excinuclease ABC subunit B [Sphingomonas suaedae]|uniref:Excinuclease ABC subunit B n=1 Tax=Sphingomonas suaedae TaxID=2599297 RepID=A0A518RBJ5_9SPHN|nr:UvrB/UvrC motif-containing protein [Sphingomonas suaedae]QDX24741.1 excinuclease ABC subunit B [Sphingomonas suaedae]
MTDTIESLERRMNLAAQSLDFEEAQRLRDRIALMRGGASAAEAERAATSGLVRQKPGSMGLGTSRQRVTPPTDWRPPAKPDPMTANHGRPSRRS